MKKSLPYILDFAFLTVGSFILALGVNMFLAPNKISSGGVSTICTILLHMFNIKMSITNIACNIVLFILGFKYLGKYAVVKTAFGILALTAFLELTSYFPVYSDDMLIATVVGGVLVGIGIGLVVKRDGSTGGSDFASLIIKRFIPHISIAAIILILDCSIIILSGIVFKSLTVTIFSIISMFISSKITDYIVTLGNNAKSVQILSDKSEEISKYIIEKLQRGVTGVYCKGMYSQSEKLMLMCTVSPKELPKLIRAVREIDKSAFIIINDSKEVLGEGFKLKSDYDQQN